MDTIAFLTLFLGLTLGVQDVRMSATHDVARIVLRLDGAEVATLRPPAWSGEVDFGRTLAPHRLSASALDASGHEIASAQQKINVPRPFAEARFVVDVDAKGAPAKAQLIWKSVSGKTARDAKVELDGVSLPVGKDMTVTIPPLSDQPHVLRGQVTTAAGETAEATEVIGSVQVAESESELTAVPMQIELSAKKVARTDLLLARGEPVEVVAVDEAAAEVIFVRDPSADESAMKLDLDSRTHKRSPAVSSGGRTQNMATMMGEGSRSDVHLRAADTIRFLWPMASPGAGETKTLLFPSSRSFFTVERGLRALLANVSAPASGENRYADAVAVAGLQAAGSRRARAVVLIVGDGYRDASALKPGGARSYLESIGVPLCVWSLSELDKLPAAAREWGEVEDISTEAKFRVVASAFATRLASQRIAWVAGDYLPQEITLTTTAPTGMRLLVKAAQRSH